MSTTNCDVRTCTTCLRVLPKTEFRLRLKDTALRHAVCRQCTTVEHRVRRQAKRERKPYEFAKAVIDSKRSKRQILALTSDLFLYFGGSKEIARVWKRSFDKASTAGRHLVASKLLIALLELHHMCGQFEGEITRDVEELTDAELERVQQQQRAAITTMILAQARKE
jgi:hypothetical protein